MNIKGKTKTETIVFKDDEEIKRFEIAEQSEGKAETKIFSVINEGRVQEHVLERVDQFLRLEDAHDFVLKELKIYLQSMADEANVCAFTGYKN